jgi:phosphatidate cytidylyltransferase
MSDQLQKRIYTSIILFFLLILMFFYTYILIISLIIISLISWVEFYSLISKIFLKKNLKHILLRFLYKSLSLLYVSFFTVLIITVEIRDPNLKLLIIYSLLISISSDIGGLLVGKTFKGKKLTKISPKKTISGSIGSFLSSILLIPIFIQFMDNYHIVTLVFITLIISLISQIGDLFISLIKRKAKVKDTSDLLPGHGGLLDRIDGIIFAVPFGFLLLNVFK